ncbi:MAG: metallophosphoesterase family protein [Verrucomicrobiia bacterium]
MGKFCPTVLVAILVFRFTVFCANSAVITIGVIGDYGSGDTNAAAVARLVKSWNPDFIITTGDNNYPVGSAETIDENIGRFYHEFIYPYYGKYGIGAISNRFFPCLGNHDWMTKDAKPYLDYFTLPGNERYYNYRCQFVEIFALDSDRNEPDGVSMNSVQARWLRNRLASSSAIWKIVFFHHSPYSSGYWHGSHTGECNFMRWQFKQWGAHLVLSGHDHLYERIHRDGLVYIVNGFGGDRLDPFNVPKVAGGQFGFNDDWGAVRIDATESNLTVRALTIRNILIDKVLLEKKGRLINLILPPISNER